jgi:hypothetical protein
LLTGPITSVMSKVEFPHDIARLIGEYVALWKYAPWVTALNLDTADIHNFVSQNPMAMDVIDVANIDWEQLCENPADWAVDLLVENRSRISWYNIARNPNPRALVLLESVEFSVADMIRCEIDEMLSANPSAIPILRKQPDLVDHTYIMWNPAAKDLIAEMKIPIFYGALAVNPADWAVDMLLSPGVLTGHDNIYGLSLNTNSRIVAYLIAHPGLIDWGAFSMNPSAIKYLRENPTKVTKSIYANSAALEPMIPDGVVELLLEL